tara:strand:+ start:501 stop:614 length:114 start_codon:yes stop_codon:yes gene_type:complete
MDWILKNDIIEDSKDEHNCYLDLLLETFEGVVEKYRN